MWKKQTLARAIRIQKENCRDNCKLKLHFAEKLHFENRKLHFAEIIKLKFGKKLPDILCISTLF